MKKEIIRINLIDRSRFIDSKNGYRLFLKDSTHYRGYTIEKESNGVYRARKSTEPYMYAETIDEIKTDIDKDIEKLSTPVYKIVLNSRWQTYGKNAKIETETKDLEEARELIASLRRSDTLSNFILIKEVNDVWKEIY